MIGKGGNGSGKKPEREASGSILRPIPDEVGIGSESIMFPQGTTRDDTIRHRAELKSIESSFERALKSLRMHFQPVVNTDDHSLFGYEALLRPNDPDLPHAGAMLDAAERLSRVHRLGRAIRNQVAEDYGDPGSDRGLLFVNLHALDLLDKNLSSPFSPLAKIKERCVLEITERASLEGLTDVAYRVAELREMGYRIAIDDLGAGHARMSQFTPLDTDFVKLDMSLVRDIQNHPMKQSLIASITQLCADEGIRVIAEGVETDAERETVARLGCDLLQGYLIAKPGPDLVDVPLRKPE